MIRTWLPLVLLLLAGCTEKWAKPGASEQDFRAMEAECEAAAYERWPPLLREQMISPGYWVPPVRRCDGAGRCAFYGGYYEPPRSTWFDQNLGPRRGDRRACFVASGWTPVDD